MRRVAAGALLAVAVAGAAGCESSQSRSARIAREERVTAIREEQALTVTQEARDVEVVDEVVLDDGSAAAVALKLRSTAQTALGRVPVAIEVPGAEGAEPYRNDSADLELGLRAVPLLAAGEETWWVNDQVPTGSPKEVDAKVGVGGQPASGPVPELDVVSEQLETSTGLPILAVQVRNTSKVDQPEAYLFSVVERGGRVVAVGRGRLQGLKAGATATGQVLFIGDPAKGRRTTSVQPTALK